MDNVIVLGLAVHALTTAFGLIVLDVCNGIIDEKIEQKGYVLRNKNSLYTFNEKLGNFLKGLIPFYYLTKSLLLVGRKKEMDRVVDERILSGKYRNVNEKIDMFEPENDITVAPAPKVEFEKPEKYKASKMDYSIYNTYETPVEYIIREMSNEEEMDLTPFDTHYVENNQKEITNNDITRKLMSLNNEELENLSSLMEYLKVKNTNDEKRRILEKDVA